MGVGHERMVSWIWLDTQTHSAWRAYEGEVRLRPGQDSHSAQVRRTGVVPEHPIRRPAPTPVLLVRGVRSAGQENPERSERVVDHTTPPCFVALCTPVN
eukprot:2529805-Pleurochrysis_carterae.AAC.1